MHFLAGAATQHHPSLLASELFWVIVAAIAGVLAVIVAITIYVISRTRRALAYEVAATPLLSERAPGALEITYAGAPVRDATLVDVDVRNVGNVPIRSNDFESGLVAQFAPGVRLLQAEVAASQPADLRPRLASTSNGIAVDPLLLNPGDGFTLQVLTSDFEGDVRLHGRVAGISEFQRSYITPQERLLRGTEIAAAAAATIGGPLLPGFGTALRLTNWLASAWIRRGER